MSRSVNSDYYRQAYTRNSRERKRRILLRALLVLVGIAALSVLLFGIFTCDGCHSQQAMDKKPVLIKEKTEDTQEEKKPSSGKRSKKEGSRESAYERALKNDREPPETSIRIITD